MKAYMLVSNKTIDPFGDHPRDCLIVNRPLSMLQQEAVASQKLSLVLITDQVQINDSEEHLIFHDYLYFTPELLQEFISRSRSLKCRTRAALKTGITTLRCMAATQNVDLHEGYSGYNLYYIPAGDYRGNELQTVVIDPDKTTEFVPMSTHMFGGAEYHVPLTDKLLIQIEHWSNLWSANISTLLGELAK